ncbi:hypothetical protein BHM03_00029444, partial [Ensete ventricosum]
MSARAVKLAADSASEVEASGHCTTRLLHAPLIPHGAPRPRPIPLHRQARRTTRPCPRDNRGKVEHTDELLSHRYKTPISAIGRRRTLFLSHSLSRSFFFLPSKGRRTDLHSPLTWASEGPYRANLPPFPTRPVCRTINPGAERDKRKDKPTDKWELTTKRWVQP